ncbi:hypothetical protein FQA47_018609 [Oryzias melastigma]|uniref:Uncharacterized protein n=1 Tax=Oryzias melastigma TaxID=30732 RepID=A0A834BUK5_ORYME|nr:hypothetical protein FQA47_018609 [Oryzias melastigma]
MAPTGRSMFNRQEKIHSSEHDEREQSDTREDSFRQSTSYFYYKYTTCNVSCLNKFNEYLTHKNSSVVPSNYKPENICQLPCVGLFGLLPPVFLLQPIPNLLSSSHTHTRTFYKSFI